MTGPRGVGTQAWLELLRVSALLTVPGDALAGAAALAARPNRGTALAIASSLCLYEAGMALNDWADRAEDAQDRPHRPIPSGRITPNAALSAAGTLSAAGLLLASRAGRPTLAVASAVTATVWAYDLKLKHTALAPATMATARALDLLMGATATAPGRPASGGAPRAAGDVLRAAGGVLGAGPGSREATGRRVRPGPGGATGRLLPSSDVASALSAAALLAAHTYGVTEVSRHEVRGGSAAVPLAALGGAAAIAVGLSRGTGGGEGLLRAARSWPTLRTAALSRSALRRAALSPSAVRRASVSLSPVRRAVESLNAVRQGDARRDLGARVGPGAGRVLACALAATYLRTAGRPLLHAALNPSPPLTQRAVGGGIRAMIPLQAALVARSGALGTGAALLALAPVARRLARKVSPT